MAQVIFDYDDFIDRYPQFKDKLTSGQLQEAFDIACLIFKNDDSSPVPYAPQNSVLKRKTLLYLLTCHIATLALRPYDQAGPVSSATEGSVNVSFALPPSPPDSFYFCQTPCGATFYQLLKQLSLGSRTYVLHEYHPYG